MGGLNNMRGDRTMEIDQCVRLLIEVLHVGYIIDLARVYGRLYHLVPFGPYEIPIPEENMIYTPFQEARDEITASLL